MNANFYAKQFENAKLHQISEYNRGDTIESIFFVVVGFLFIIFAFCLYFIYGSFDDFSISAFLGIIAIGAAFIFFATANLFSSKFRLFFHGGNPIDVLYKEVEYLSRTWSENIKIDPKHIQFKSAFFWGNLRGYYCYMVVPYGATNDSQLTEGEPTAYLVAHYASIRKRRPLEGFGKRQWIPLKLYITYGFEDAINQICDINEKVVRGMRAATAARQDDVILDAINFPPLVMLKCDPVPVGSKNSADDE